MKPRLLFVSNLFPDHAEPYRGLDNATVLHHLADRWDVRVLALRPRLSAWWGRGVNLRARETDEVFEPEFLAVPYVPKLGSRWNHRLAAKALRPAMQRLDRSFHWDVVLGAWLFPDGCALANCEDERPLHLIAQGSDVHRYLGDPLRRAAIMDAVKRATSVITRSASLAQALMRAGATGSRVRPIVNGVDTDCFRVRDQAKMRAVLGVDAQSKVVLFVGNLLPVKDPNLLLQTFAHLVVRDAVANWQLVVIGKGPLKDRLTRIAVALGVAARVRFTGPLAAEAVAQWMSAADVLCLTSWNEGLPNVILEALACGLPVVATNVGGVVEAIDAEWKGTVCNSRSPIDIAAALEQALKNTDRASIAAHATRHWSATADAYHEALSSSKS